MKKLTFSVQMRISLGIYLLCFFLAHVLKHGWLTNVGWISYGLFWIANPVWPPSWDWRDHSKMRLGIRIAGVLAIMIGLVTRFAV